MSHSPNAQPAVDGPTAHAPHAASADGRTKRQLRAVVAQRLRSRAADAVASLDWDALDAAPGWLALPDAELQRFEAQVGAILCAPMLKLWIDGPRLSAARAALGAGFLQALRALPSTQILPSNVAPCPRIDSAEQVAAQLRSTGASVLLASMQPGPLRLVVAAAMAPATPAAMVAPLAQSLIAQAITLAERPADTGSRA
ncbi:MAG TPA: hypothetical protein VLJ62_15275 [Burkholderiaceae bacterium]|nr:hypothetical protein [Burkholderiaceae bacterium]